MGRWFGAVVLVSVLTACSSTSSDKADVVSPEADTLDVEMDQTLPEVRDEDAPKPNDTSDQATPDLLPDPDVVDVAPDGPTDCLDDTFKDVDSEDTVDTSAPEVVDISILPGKVRVVRDKWGMPHVLADSDYGAGYGYGYALAHDNLAGLLDAAWTVQGRRSEFEGEAGLGMDRTMRMFRMVADMEKDFPNMPVVAQDLLDGIADGVNRFMTEHPEKVPAWGNEPFKPWWSPAIAKMIFFTPALTGANNELDGWCEQLWELSFGLDASEHFTIGSNGFAMMADRTQEGVALMGGDPHLPWKFEWRFYEVHMRAKTFEVAGASPIGSPLPVLGRTHDIAWTWTSNGPDHGDVYLVPMDTENPGHYILDGESLPFETREETFKMPDGTTRAETMSRSQHGPIVCFREDHDMAIAMRLTVDGQTGAGGQFINMMAATNLDEFDDAMESLQIGHFSLVAADTSGNVEYHWGGRIPQRKEGYNYDAPLDGSTSDTLWGWDEMIPYNQLPKVRNPGTGWVQSCNNGPDNTTMTEDDPDLATIPMGVTDVGNEEVRSWYLRRQLSRPELFSELDGLALITDGYMIPHNPLVGLLVYAYEQYGANFPGNDLFDQMIGGLANWDGMPTITSWPPTVFTIWLFFFADSSSINPAWMDWTQADITQERANQMLAALAEARDALVGAAGFFQVPWGMVHPIRKGAKTFGVNTGQYPAISLMNTNVDFSTGDFETLSCNIGSSYTFFNVMEKPIRTWSVLPLGPTDDPELPYVYTQTQMFSQRKLKPLSWTDAEILENFKSQVVLDLPTY